VTIVSDSSVAFALTASILTSCTRSEANTSAQRCVRPAKGCGETTGWD
jgi:hypothetical protein